MKWLGRVLALGATLFVLSVAFIIWIVFTPAGTGFAIDMAVDRSDGALSYASLEGRLSDDFVIHELQLSVAGARTRVARLELAWYPAALLRGRLAVRLLRVSGVRHVAPPSAEPAAPQAIDPVLPRLPFEIHLERVVVEDVVLGSAAETAVLENLEAGFRLAGDGATISELSVRALGYELRGELQLEGAQSPELSGSLTVRAGDQTNPLSAALDFRGPPDALLVDAELHAPLDATLTARLDLVAAVPRIEAGLRLHLPARAPDGLQADELEVSLAGDLDALKLNAGATLSAQGAEWGAINLDANLERVGDGLSGQLTWTARTPYPVPWQSLDGRATFAADASGVVVDHQTRSPLSSRADLKVDLRGATPALQTEIRLAQTDIELPDGTVFGLEDVLMRAEGPLNKLALELDATARHTDAGPVSLMFRGQADGIEQSLHIETLETRLLEGLLAISGSLAAGDGLLAAAAIKAHELDLSILYPELDARVSFDAGLDIEQEQTKTLAILQLHQTSGRWRGQPLEFTGSARYDGSRTRIERFRFSLGDNVAELDASFGDGLAGRFNAHFEDLSDLYENLDGKLVANGTLGGTALLPSVQARAEGTGLRWLDWSLSRLNVAADIDLTRQATQRAKVELEKLSQGDTAFGNVSAAISGETERHTITLDAGRVDQRLRLKANGGIRDERWLGEVLELSLDLGAYGAWLLDAPAAVVLDRETAALAASCLKSADARVCIEVPEFGAQEGEIELSLDRLSLDFLADFLPTTLVAQGYASAQASVVRRAGTDALLGSLSIADGRVDLTTADGKLDSVPVTEFVAEFEFAAGVTRVQLSGALADWLAWDASVKHRAVPDSGLSAHVDANAASLSWLEQFVPDIAGTRGAARLALDVDGTMSAPRVRLEAALTDGAIAVPAAGLKLTKFAVDITQSDGSLAVLQARLGGADGLVDIVGEVDTTTDKGWPGRVRLSSERFAAVRLPDVEADLAPDLELVFSREQLDIQGRLELPRVHVQVSEVPPGAVTVSEDEVIVGEETENDGEPARNFFTDAVTGNVELVVGDDVRIAAAGLEARLTGAMRWTKQRGDSLGRGEGRISIAEGAYEAYGQRLDIQRGHLTFAGPMDNPALDLQAVRANIDITAGLRVSGALGEPQIDLFSEPPLPDAEVLAYLITGRGLDGASSGDAGLITAAALSLGAERASMITGQVSNAFGLDEFSVNASGGVADTTFTAGKRLTPKLSVRSQFNPFDRLWSFFFNYKLTSNWSVEAESGVRQGADVIYSIESEALIPENLPDPTEWFD